MNTAVDVLLDRVSDLLKLCDRADQTGARVVTTSAVRAILAPPAPQVTGRFTTPRRKTVG